MNEYAGGNYLIYKSSFLATRVIENYLEPAEFEIEVGFQFGPTEAKVADDVNNEQTLAYNKIEFFVDMPINITRAICEKMFIELLNNKIKIKPPNTERGTVSIIING